MRKIIWSCWFQGREAAPELVRACFESWERRNPGWRVRVLDAADAAVYAPALAGFDLQPRTIAAAALSDILRLSLLHEYGGVWADATTFCQVPLDDWLGDVMGEGVFAFDRPHPSRPLATWFIAATPGHPLIAKWAAACEGYWRGRRSADHYFWVHRLFDRLCAQDPEAAAIWARVPKISADGPHAIQRRGMLRPARDVEAQIDWSTPVFKLTYRNGAKTAAPDSLLRRLIGSSPPAGAAHDAAAPAPDAAFASLSVGTENLGDHIQIHAARDLLARFGHVPTLDVDRDFGLRSALGIGPHEKSRPILLNGWFKRDSDEWPPGDRLDPIFLGFHLRPFQSPRLMGEESLAYLRGHAPIGCRDAYTAGALSEAGVDAHETNCLTVTFPRRLPARGQSEIFVVSRDGRLAARLRSRLGPFVSVLHYSGDDDFARNMERARALLDAYRDRARLIVTTLLHCALPALAMGVPVVMFRPLAPPAGRRSDDERFSSLVSLIPVHDLEQVADVDFAPTPPDLGAQKLALLDALGAALAARGLARRRRIGPIAASTNLPMD